MKKQISISLVWFAFVVTFGLSASAAGQCTYDTSGHNLMPDGQIVVQAASGKWWEGDALACLYVHENGPYALYSHYFPRCDLDSNGAITLDEVYSVYYHVYPGGQDDKFAARYCLEWFRDKDTNYVYCPGNWYPHFKSGLDAIRTNYEGATLREYPKGDTNPWHNPDYNRMNDSISCHFPNDNQVLIPVARFAELNGCYNAETECNTEATNGVACMVRHSSTHPLEFYFNNPLYAGQVFDQYEALVEPDGGNCYLDTYDPTDANIERANISATDIDADGWITWRISDTFCYSVLCNCSIDATVRTHIDYPGYVDELHFGCPV